MRAIISEKLQAYLQQVGSTVLTVTLDPLRCWSGTFYDVSVDTREPKDPGYYESFIQDGTRIYYSPRLGRKSDVLELDYVRILFRCKPIMSGPEELVAEVIMGRFWIWILLPNLTICATIFQVHAIRKSQER